MPKERRKYDLESLWTVGPEFDENVQKELELKADPFAAYLKDFGHKTDEDAQDSDSVKVQPLAESAKRRYGKMYMGSATDWHTAKDN